jgi:hypothetical protein
MQAIQPSTRSTHTHAHIETELCPIASQQLKGAAQLQDDRDCFEPRDEYLALLKGIRIADLAAKEILQEDGREVDNQMPISDPWLMHSCEESNIRSTLRELSQEFSADVWNPRTRLRHFTCCHPISSASQHQLPDEKKHRILVTQHHDSV